MAGTDIDIYTPVLGPVENLIGTNHLAKQWHPRAALRRWAYYQHLDALLKNENRPGSTIDRTGHGDAQALIDAITTGETGDGFTIRIPGANTPPPTTPQLPDYPPEPGPDATDLDRLIHQTAVNHITRTRETITEEWIQQLADHPTRTRLQHVLDEFLTAERVLGRIPTLLSTTNALGDGTATLTWSPTHNRPTLRFFEPDAYFPVLPDGGDASGMPDTVHFAWEHDHTTPDGNKQRRITRITYRLVPLTIDPETGDAVPDPTGTNPNIDPETGETYQVEIPTSWDPNTIRTHTVLYTEATWVLSNIQNQEPDALKTSEAVQIVAHDEDLEIDWIPVIHLRGPGPDGEHWGTSVLSSVYKALLDLNAENADFTEAVTLASVPAVAYSGPATVDETIAVEPGVFINLGWDPTHGRPGTATVIDVSGALPRLLEAHQSLLTEIRGNARVPGEILGATDSRTAVSGFAMTQSIGRFVSLVESLRALHEPPLRLLAKHTLRLYRQAGIVPPGPDVTPEVVWGAAVPTETDAAVTRIVNLYQAGLVSIETAVARLAEIGVTAVKVPEDEVALIRSSDFEGAALLVEATGNVAAAADRLGVKPAVDI